MFLYYYVNLCHSFFPSPFFFSLLGHRSNEKRLLESFQFFFFFTSPPSRNYCCEKWRNKNKKKQTTFVHHLKNTLFSAFGTENIGAIGDESFSDQRHVAASALEAIIMPMAVLERDKSCAANTWTAKKLHHHFGNYCKQRKFRMKYSPVMGLVQAVQRLANSSPKHSAQ